MNTSDYTSISSKSLDEMENVCKSRFNRTFYIKNHSFIDYKTLLRLRKLIKETSQQIVTEYIETSKPGEPSISYSFLIEDFCPDCNTIQTVEVSKTRLLDYISKRTEFECNSCKKNRYKQISEKNKIQAQKREQNKQKLTEDFITSFCDSNYHWNTDISPKSYFSKLQNRLFETDENKVVQYLKSLPYQDFLKTPYWIAIATKKKHQARFMCELCGHKGLLNVHHKTYEHHGDEIHNLKDLIVLCSDCHEKFHDIVD